MHRADRSRFASRFHFVGRAEAGASLPANEREKESEKDRKKWQTSSEFDWVERQTKSA